MPTISNLYIALFTADDGLEAGTITSEVSGGSYARLQIDGATYTLTTASGTTNEVTNAEVYPFAAATANWGTITHGALMDASSGGNVLYHGALQSSVQIDSGQQFQFDIGAFKLAED
ncbi:MAG: hypothetical protein RPU42_11120 [Candidatus Sedimenticola sp. (ex Thyasira tokunagai)]